MAVLDQVMDPEIPVVSITDLGIVRAVTLNPPRVMISPTYTGCPATLAIEQAIRDALDAAGFRHVFVERVLFPPWTTDWITERGRQRLKAYGIAPPNPSATAEYDRGQPFRLDAVQGAVAVQRLSRAFRPLQMPLNSASSAKLWSQCSPM